MTALEEYARLESTGLWRAAPDEQLRDVGLSFGDATLVLSDQADRPLTHWSLPAIQRLNKGTRPALFSPDPEGTETLEIADDLMIEALEKVRHSLDRQRPRQGRLRMMTSLSILAAAALAAWIWLPDALVRQSLGAVPSSKQGEIGATILGHMQRTTGPVCRNSLGNAALATLQTRILGPEVEGQIVVVRQGLVAPTHLPGGIIVLPLSVIRSTDDPVVVAGHALAAMISRTQFDPMEDVLTHAGIGPTFTLLTTGDIPDEALQDYAQHRLTEPAPLANAETLGAGFANAEVPMSPWAYALDPSGESIEDLLAVEWLAEGEAATPTLQDGEWVSLQGICQN